LIDEKFNYLVDTGVNLQEVLIGCKAGPCVSGAEEKVSIYC
jgi:hypothetical protein